ncbi:MAG: hypothetical protein WBL93_04170 [Lutisporaceae bacterium]
MKKVIVILLVLALCLSFVSCKAEKVIEDKNVPASNTTETVENTPAPIPQNDDALKLAREGKITGLSIQIGSKLQDAVAQLGEPIGFDNFEGVSYVSYEVIDLMLDKIIEDTKSEANISGIIMSEGYELYGVKVGMSPAQIKVMLGTPTQELLETDAEGDMWKMDYDCGEYLLSFYSADKDTATVSAYLSKKQ